MTPGAEFNKMTKRRVIRLIAAITAVVLLTWLFVWFPEISEELDGESISRWVKSAGYWGPVLIIALMTFAIVATPIPSAPIALASGAAYGHYLGTLYVLIGAELGALIAFTLARILGRDVLKRWFGDAVDSGWLGSQNALMSAVFASRLLPFVSFDLVSYAAGLSSLLFWRFALATLVGIVPASFLLAHFGDEAASGETWRATWAALIIGLFVLIPIFLTFVRKQKTQDLSGDNFL